MNIIIPMAGRGERFRKEGFSLPKPLIEFNNKTMIEYAIESLGIEGNYIFITYKYEDDNLNLRLNNILNTIVKNPIIIQIDYITEGPASSALLAQEFINNEEELVITNCDQIMTWDTNDFINYTKDSDLDGIVVTYDVITEKNSYIKIEENGFASKLAEKEIISNLSLNGIHYWKKGSYFVSSTTKMIKNNIRVNNEFYISLSYNEMIKQGLKVGNYHIENENHHAVGTPEDLKKYLENGNN
jgi:NDP-sugar pyrophosphorylase family protein